MFSENCISQQIKKGKKGYAKIIRLSFNICLFDKILSLLIGRKISLLPASIKILPDLLFSTVQ